MNRNEKIYDAVVSCKLKKKDREDLERLCSALGVTKSEFLRMRISNINNVIMRNNLFNISKAEKADAWGRNLENEKASEERKFKKEFNEKFNIIEKNEGETPFNTSGEILNQLKNKKESTERKNQKEIDEDFTFFGEDEGVLAYSTTEGILNQLKKIK